MTNPTLDQAVESLRPEIVETLSRWIRIPSEKLPPEPDAPFGRPLREMLVTALSDAETLGCRTRDFDGYIGDAEIGAGNETMGILVHLDVVPAGDGWAMDPFGGEVQGDKLYGRGTSDNKGPAVAAMYAMKAVQDAGVHLKKKVRLILGCDEESGWADIRHYKSRVAMPDFGFSPDAVFPIINTEKGILQLTLSAALAPEDGASIPVYSVHAGERPNVIPGLAKAEIGCEDFESLRRELNGTGFDVTAEKLPNGRIQLISTGVQGHAAKPGDGKNAAGQLLLALSALSAGGGSRAVIRKLADSIGVAYDGAGLGIDGSDAISGSLTLNLGVLRIADGRLHAMIDIRHPVLMSAEMIAKIIGMRLRDVNISVDVAQQKAPLHVPEESFIVQSLLFVYHRLTGCEPYTIAIGGGTYSRSMENCVAFGSTLPGAQDLAHQANEHISIDNLMLSVRIFAHAIVALAT
ncbi:MAG: Sapep family Mn(2+)-dependent dipeptidase [Clostridia bacterium]|nr:Sapep family Mn(2+)-dependent dipeptidase [Clostridia bacterium]